VNEDGIDGTVIGVFNMNAVARAIGDGDMRDVQAVRRGPLEMYRDGPDSRTLAIGNGICAADGNVLYGDIGDASEIQAGKTRAAFDSRMFVGVGWFVAGENIE
jgi:hypothetical protein